MRRTGVREEGGSACQAVNGQSGDSVEISIGRSCGSVVAFLEAQKQEGLMGFVHILSISILFRCVCCDKMLKSEDVLQVCSGFAGHMGINKWNADLIGCLSRFMGG